jgi:hypothetical protein
MKRISLIATMAVLALLATAAPSYAAGEEGLAICVPEGAGAPVKTPWPEGKCPPVYPEVGNNFLIGRVEQTITPTEAKMLSHMHYIENGFAGQPTIEIESANVRLDSGFEPGHSEGTGNLIVGAYPNLTASPWPLQDNLVVSYWRGGAPPAVLGGDSNVLLGRSNTAKGGGNFVAGNENITTGFDSILGGQHKTATKEWESLP